MGRGTWRHRSWDAGVRALSHPLPTKGSSHRQTVAAKRSRHQNIYSVLGSSAGWERAHADVGDTRVCTHTRTHACAHILATPCFSLPTQPSTATFLRMRCGHIQMCNPPPPSSKEPPLVHEVALRPTGPSPKASSVQTCRAHADSLHPHGPTSRTPPRPPSAPAGMWPLIRQSLCPQRRRCLHLLPDATSDRDVGTQVPGRERATQAGDGGPVWERAGYAEGRAPMRPVGAWPGVGEAEAGIPSGQSGLFSPLRKLVAGGGCGSACCCAASESPRPLTCVLVLPWEEGWGRLREECPASGVHRPQQTICGTRGRGPGPAWQLHARGVTSPGRRCVSFAPVTSSC